MPMRDGLVQYKSLPDAAWLCLPAQPLALRSVRLLGTRDHRQLRPPQTGPTDLKAGSIEY